MLEIIVQRIVKLFNKAYLWVQLHSPTAWLYPTHSTGVIHDRIAKQFVDVSSGSFQQGHRKTNL